MVEAFQVAGRQVDTLGIEVLLQVNYVHAEPLQAGVAGGAHAFGPPVDAEGLAGRVTDVAELRGQHDLAAPVTNGLPDQRLICAQAVYMSAVSRRLTPRSRARWIVANASASSPGP